jgi:hypothetical protein
MGVVLRGVIDFACTFVVLLPFRVNSVYYVYTKQNSNMSTHLPRRFSYNHVLITMCIHLYLNLTLTPFYKRYNYTNLSKGLVTYNNNTPTQNRIQPVRIILTAYTSLSLMMQYVLNVDVVQWMHFKAPGSKITGSIQPSTYISLPCHILTS